jgi:hypothetical protein
MLARRRAAGAPAPVSRTPETVMTPRVLRGAAAALLALTAAACSAAREDPPPPSEDSPMATSTPAAADTGGWRPLFDGRTTAGWRGYRSQEVPAGWQVVDGALTRVDGGGDIVTTEQFGDFELELEWNVTPGGNSGIMYRVTEEAGNSYETGPEVQILDDARHADGRSRLTAAGAAYGLYPAPENVARPAGQWNQVRLVVDGNRVEHWLNGRRIVEYEIGSEDWNRRVAGSKFAAWPGFARAARGHIALQDHGDRVAFRNIRIRELP